MDDVNSSTMVLTGVVCLQLKIQLDLHYVNPNTITDYFPKGLDLLFEI